MTTLASKPAFPQFDPKAEAWQIYNETLQECSGDATLAAFERTLTDAHTRGVIDGMERAAKWLLSDGACYSCQGLNNDGSTDDDYDGTPDARHQACDSTIQKAAAIRRVAQEVK